MPTTKKATTEKEKPKVAPKKAVEKPAVAAAAKPIKAVAKKSEKPGMKVPKESYYGTGRRKCSIAKVWMLVESSSSKRP